MKKIIRIVTLLLALAFLLTSCKKEKKTCGELLSAGLEYGINGYANSGYIYLMDAEESSVLFISEKTRENMYGKRFLGVFSVLCDFAIYTSASSPYEIAVFKCYSKNDTDEILRMCYERADKLKVGLKYTEWESASKWISVSVYKKYIIFAFTDSAERSEGAAERIIKLIDD